MIITNSVIELSLITIVNIIHIIIANRIVIITIISSFTQSYCHGN